MTVGQPLLVMLLFPLTFVAVWLLVARIIALFGWDRLARTYAFQGAVPATAAKFAYQSGSTASGTVYRNCLHVWIDQSSFYLRPSRIFALFHPILRIDYRDVVAVTPRQWRNGVGYAFALPDDRHVISLYGPAAVAAHDANQKIQTNLLSERPDQ